MRYLLDTNVFREVQKGPTGHVHVRAWLASVDDADLRLSVMTVTEVRRGIVRLAKWKVEAARALAERFDVLLAAYAGRVIAVDRAVADEWGRLQGEKDNHLTRTARERRAAMRDPSYTADVTPPYLPFTPAPTSRARHAPAPLRPEATEPHA